MSLKLGVASSANVTILTPQGKQFQQISFPQPFTPNAIVWSSSNKYLFFSSPTSIHRVPSEGGQPKCILDLRRAETSKIGSIAIKDDGGTVMFSKGAKVRIWDPSTKKLVSTLDSGITCNVESIHLNCDESFLATVTSKTVHLWDLNNGNARQMLNGCPLGITAATFDTHYRNRLLLASKSEVVLYNTKKPTSPSSRISVSSSNSDPVQVFFSPHHESLFAVAYRDGTVKILDLDAPGDSVVRSMDFQTNLTCACFARGGRYISVGTEDGKLITCNLSAMDQPFQETIIDPSGGRVESIVVMKKIPETLKALSEKSGRNTSRVAPTDPGPSKPSVERHIRATVSDKENDSRSASSSSLAPSSKLDSRTRSSSARLPPTSLLSSKQSLASISSAPSTSADVVPRRTASDPLIERTRARSPQPPVSRPVSVLLQRAESWSSTTPQGNPLILPKRAVARNYKHSPLDKELSDTEGTLPGGEPPVRQDRKQLGKRSSHGTEDVEHQEQDIKPSTSDSSADRLHSPKQLDRSSSPKLKSPKSAPTTIPSHLQLNKSTALQISPFRNGKAAIITPPANSPSHHRRQMPTPSDRGLDHVQEVLRMMMKDVLCETQHEMRQEIQALHLDMIKSKRLWKNEMRNLMEEYVGDLKDLREENLRLRQENELLRRGY